MNKKEKKGKRNWKKQKGEGEEAKMAFEFETGRDLDEERR